jgi:Holliday junction resolvase
MATNGQNKGRVYERRISKILSDWCGFELIRTPMSGAWQGTAGDIKPKDESQLFPFVVECKKSENWNMEQILAGTGPFVKWVAQAQAEIIKDKANGRTVHSFMLIFSRNNRPDYIAVPLSLMSDTQLMLLQLTSAPYPNSICTMCNGYSMLVFELEKFIAYIKYAELLKIFNIQI